MGDKTSGRRTHHPTKDNKKRDKLGYKLEDKGEKALGRHQTKGNKKEDKLGDKLEDKLGDKLGGKVGDKLGDKLGDKGDKGREGGHTIQQRETRRQTMGEKRDKTPGKADTPSNKGKQKGRQ